MTEILTIDAEAIDQYADVLTGVATALVEGDRKLARERLAPIAGERWFGSLKLAGPQSPGGTKKRTGVPDRVRARVFIRDGFRCTWCAKRVVPRSVLVAFSDVFPNEIPYERHYTRGRIHPVYLALAAEADHDLAHARGGSNELVNLTTLHAFCNTQKGDSLREDLMPVERPTRTGAWDGLTSVYPEIVAAAEFRHSAETYHPAWIRRFAFS